MRKFKKILLRILIVTLSISSILCNSQEASAFSVSGLGNSREIINSSPLNPMRTGDKAIDDYIDNIFAQIITPQMDTFEKVKACYDYLINNVSYGYDGYFTQGISKQFSSQYDSDIAISGIQTLYAKSGVCRGYSAAFVLMTRALGLDSYAVNGVTGKADGGWTGHNWVNIYINGTYYVFDPQVEDNIARGGSINYYCFCKTDSEVYNDYRYNDRNKDVYSFKNFKEIGGWVKPENLGYREFRPFFESTWYYYTNGKAKTGWLEIDSKKYYLDKNKDGLMVMGFCKIDKKYYNFDKSGALIGELDKDLLPLNTEYYDCNIGHFRNINKVTDDLY